MMSKPADTFLIIIQISISSELYGSVKWVVDHYLAVWPTAVLFLFTLCHDREGLQKGAESPTAHRGIFRTQKGEHFPQMLVETETELKEDRMLDLNPSSGQKTQSNANVVVSTVSNCLLIC